MQKTINLPKSIEELKSIIKSSIESYSQSPVKNNNKLNEVLSKSLGFDNYDQLSSTIKEMNKTRPLVVCIVELPIGSCVCIGEEFICDEVFDENMVDYILVEREVEISNISDSLAGTYGEEREMLLADISILQLLDDVYIFSNISTNEYIAASNDIDGFNSLCEEILDKNRLCCPESE